MHISLKRVCTVIIPRNLAFWAAAGARQCPTLPVWYPEAVAHHVKCVHVAGDALGGIKLNHNPFSAIKQPPADPTAERETDMAQLPSQPQAASGPATELTQDPDVDMLDTENQPDR